MKQRLEGLTAALLLTTLSFAPSAAANDGVALSPYTASYRTSMRGLKIDTQRELKRESRGRFTLVENGKNMIANLQQVGVFDVEGERIVPRSFVYQLSAPLLKRRREVHFKPGTDTIRSLYKGEWYELPYRENTLDRFSQQEQLRLYLLNNPAPEDNIRFRVADGKRIKEYEFLFRGEEVIDTPLGRVNTLHFERSHDSPDRRSETWIAPEWDYLMVRTVHVEDGAPGEAVITAASIDGVPVSDE
jgi:hypothetical protein